MKLLAALLLLLPALARADDTEAACRTHLKHLGGAVAAYKLVHNNPPAKLSDLYLDGFVDSYGDFVCPSSGASITTTGEIDSKSDYALGTGNTLIEEKAGHHLAAFADGSIKPVTTTDTSSGGPRSGEAATSRPPPPPVTSQPSDNTEDPSEFSLIPPGTKIPPQPPAPPAPALGPRPTGYVGAHLQDTATPGQGALVVEIFRGSPAEAGGLNTGDLIVALNGEPVESSRQFADQLSNFSPDAKVSLLIVRNGRNQKLTLTLGTKPAGNR